MFEFLKNYFKTEPVQIDLREITFEVVISDEERYLINEKGWCKGWDSFFDCPWYGRASFRDGIASRSNDGLFRISKDLQIPLCNIKEIRLIEDKEFLVMVSKK